MSIEYFVKRYAEKRGSKSQPTLAAKGFSWSSFLAANAEERGPLPRSSLTWKKSWQKRPSGDPQAQTTLRATCRMSACQYEPDGEAEKASFWQGPADAKTVE